MINLVRCSKFTQKRQNYCLFVYFILQMIFLLWWEFNSVMLDILAAILVSWYYACIDTLPTAATFPADCRKLSTSPRTLGRSAAAGTC